VRDAGGGTLLQETMPVESMVVTHYELFLGLLPNFQVV
jgi:hypothetical protein